MFFVNRLSRTILDLEAEESAVEVFLKSQENKEQQLKLKLQQLKMETSALSRNLLAVSFINCSEKISASIYQS